MLSRGCRLVCSQVLLGCWMAAESLLGDCSTEFAVTSARNCGRKTEPNIVLESRALAPGVSSTTCEKLGHYTFEAVLDPGIVVHASGRPTFKLPSSNRGCARPLLILLRLIIAAWTWLEPVDLFLQSSMLRHPPLARTIREARRGRPAPRRGQADFSILYTEYSRAVMRERLYPDSGGLGHRQDSRALLSVLWT
jgi:hypothetical protein